MTPADLKAKDRILGRMLDDAKTGQERPSSAGQFSALDDLLGELDDFFGSARATIGVAKLSSTENEVTMVVELNGFDPAKLSVEVAGNVVTLSGLTEKRTGEGAQESVATTVFAEVYTLIRFVDGEKSSAQVKDGVLTVTLPILPGDPLRPFKVEIS